MIPMIAGDWKGEEGRGRERKGEEGRGRERKGWMVAHRYDLDRNNPHSGRITGPEKVILCKLRGFSPGIQQIFRWIVTQVRLPWVSAWGEHGSLGS